MSFDRTHSAHGRVCMTTETASSANGEPWHEATVLDEIAAERRRQIEAEGFTPDHDDLLYEGGEMARAAAAYCATADLALRGCEPLSAPPAIWPWHANWFKPKRPRRDLIRAAALIVAEIERLDRAAKFEPSPVRCNECDWEGDATELLEEGHCPQGCHAASVAEVSEEDK